MLSAESVGGMSIWTFSDDFPLLSAAEAFEVYMLYIQGGQKKKDVVARTAKIKKTAAHLSSSMRIFTCVPPLLISAVEGQISIIYNSRQIFQL